MRIKDDNYLNELRKQNDKALTYIIDLYGSLVNEMFSRYCYGATEENKTITVGLDKGDLLVSEKRNKKLSLKIKEVDMFKYGDWNFTIK